MIAARLAGGNLFLPFCGGDFVVGILWWGIFGGGFFGSTRSSSEHSDFFEGIFLRGDSFFWGGVGCVLD